jgi:hypothetical protein
LFAGDDESLALSKVLAGTSAGKVCSLYHQKLLHSSPKHNYFVEDTFLLLLISILNGGKYVTHRKTATKQTHCNAVYCTLFSSENSRKSDLRIYLK